MNKKMFVPAAIAALMGVGAYFGNATATPAEGLSDLQLENAEALANDDEDSSYKNGFRLFLNEPGGAYDCEKVWRPLKPDPNYPCF